MAFVKLTIAVDETVQELLIAELMDLGFEAFQQLPHALVTYDEGELTSMDRQKLMRILDDFDGEADLNSEVIIEDQNWNADWEKTIRPQSIGRFLVRPTWSDKAPGSDQILLEIDPEMAFGTGYHETTRLMLRWLPEVVKSKANVLDAGTGSGILAIAAVKLGASRVLAFDKDFRSVQNARKNNSLNRVGEQIKVRKGTQKVVNEKNKFDLILANIQRNVIIEMLPMFAKSLEPGGQMLLSGLLKSEKSLMISQLNDLGLKFKDTAQENKWIAIKATK